jgi:hypothetical protein
MTSKKKADPEFRTAFSFYQRIYGHGRLFVFMPHCLLLFSVFVFSDLLPPFLDHTTHRYHYLPESLGIGLFTPSQYAMSIDIRKPARILHTLKMN